MANSAGAQQDYNTPSKITLLCLKKTGGCSGLNFLILLVLYYGLLVLPTLAKVEICFPTKGIYKNFYPPSQPPPDRELVYTVSVNQRMSRPIIAQLCENGHPINDTHPDYSHPLQPREFKIQSLDVQVATKMTFTDSLQDHLILCQYAANNYPIHDPRRYDTNPNYSSKRCAAANVLCIKYFKNLLVVQGLYYELRKANPDIHVHTYLRRVLRFVYVRSDYTMTHKDTGEIGIRTNEAFGLKWTEPPKSRITANTPFNLKLSIVDKNNNVITTGLDSTLVVEVTVEYSNKYFTFGTRVEDFLYFTKMMMDGDEVITSARNRDKILRKRAVNGVVEFNGVRLLDASSVMFLNATLIVPRSQVRQPDNYTDISNDCDRCTRKLYAYNVDDSADPGLQVMTFTPECSMKCRSQAVTISEPFSVAEQTANQIIILQREGEKKNKGTVYFNLPDIWVKIVDEHGETIHSGADAELFIDVTTDPPGIKLSKDSSFKTYRGQGRFLGSICEAVEDVKLVFKTSSAAGKILENSTSSFEITSNIHVGVLGHVDITGNEPEPNVETFSQLAINDINDGFYKEMDDFKDLEGKKLVLKSYNTYGEYHAAINAFFDAISAGEDDSSQTIRIIIYVGSEELLVDLDPFIEAHNMPLITTASTHEYISKAVGGENIYRTVMPLCWNSISVAVNLGLMLSYRQWNKLVVIECEKYPIPRAIYRKWLIFNIDVTVVNMPDVPEDEWDSRNLSIWDEVTNAGTKIIFHYVPYPLQFYLYQQAIKFKFASVDGYQWITIEHPARGFISATDYPCYEEMKGMMLIISVFFVQGFRSDRWFHINQQYFGMDRELYRGIPTTRKKPDYTDIALGYDAVLMLAHALQTFFSSTNETIDGYLLSQQIIKKKFDGLTGEVEFEDERRVGFLGAISSVSASEEECVVLSRLVSIPKELEMFVVAEHEAILKWTSEVLVENDKSVKRLVQGREHQADPDDLLKNLPKSQWQTEIIALPERKTVPVPLFLPKASAPSFRFYLSRRKKIIKQENLTIDPNDIVLRTEFYVTPFTCHLTYGCGQQTSALDYTHFHHGECVGENHCRCKLVSDIDPNHLPEEVRYSSAYYGQNCEHVACSNCDQGECFTPFKCTCVNGWETENSSSLVECGKPMCKKVECKNGICIAPDTCECFIGYFGDECDMLLGVIVLIVLLFVLILCIFLFAYLHWRRRRKQKNLTASNLDWLVEWEDVIENTDYKDIHTVSPEITSRASVCSPINLMETKRILSDFDQHPTTAKRSVSRSIEWVTSLSRIDGSPHISETALRYVRWKNKECFVKKIDRPSLDINDLEIRKEIHQMKDLQHPNLVPYIGICAQFPNVCILVEIMPKGSLDQIISNTSFSINWNFKYSLLRDICRGMEYLHNSKMGSHGRLKSPNCLVDNRWTCKITGYGLPTVRTKSYALYEFETMRRQLLWTAPELLRLHSNPSEVGKGTKLGDSYSFGIILTELCSHKKPWDEELAIISLEELIRILKDVTHPANRGIKRLLETHNYDTSKPLRPEVLSSHMPDSYHERKLLKRLIAELTNEDPVKRPSFKEIAITLQTIHPLKGELVENLIDMLEHYTNHLEDMLTEKIQEIELEKKKTEDVLARLFPASIAEQLKHNQEVKPQKHDDVTILFSDIKSFTPLAKASTPMQVVTLLNELYTVFDNIVDGYDAYNLETIGDSYCVVSGIPTPNTLHAEDVTSIALDICAALYNFPIRHLPGKYLECRIGVNSGSVVAGVLGVKMPQYCIFGVDVVIAAQMQRNGESKKVHISENTARLIKDSDKFVLQYRGEMVLKTVGAMKTYFVFRKGFSIERKFSSLSILSLDYSLRRESSEASSSEEGKKKTTRAIQARFSVMGQKRKPSQSPTTVKSEIFDDSSAETL